MPRLNVTHLRHVALVAPEFERSRTFFSDAWGLTRAGDERGRAFFRTVRTEPYQLDLLAGPKRAIARIKNLCRHAGENTLEAQLDLEAGHMSASLGDDEAAEGIGAFFEKRPADFAALRRAPAVHSS